MKEKTEDKILKLPPVEVAKMHQEYGRAFCRPSKTKFVRKKMTEDESKETFKRIEASRPASPCLAEETARTAYEEIKKKLEEKSE